MSTVDPASTLVDNDSIRTFLDLMLKQDPRLFLKACATDPAFADLGAGILAVYMTGRAINERVYAPTTVKTYLEQAGIPDVGGLAVRAGRLAAQAYRAHHGTEPEGAIETGPKGKTITVSAYRGADIRFIADAVRQTI